MPQTLLRSFSQVSCAVRMNTPERVSEQEAHWMALFAAPRVALRADEPRRIVER